jgi:protoporphyrinogen oxidase
MSARQTEFLILGAGPTGLGAACRLQEKGQDWHLLEATPIFGGLASSWVDAEGFTWDIGGHVQFSHYNTFDRHMDQALGTDGWLTHQRESWVWIRNRFVPYPFQNNLHRLDPAERWRCAQGLWEVARRQVDPGAEGSVLSHFGDWITATFGEGIAEIFMLPYNRKVWAYAPEELDYGWIGDRVAVPDFGRILRSVCTHEDDVSWGPNAVFRFPRRGGTGAVWTSIGRSLDARRVSLESEAVSVDVAAHLVTTRSGESWRYRSLISTIPLNRLIQLAPGVVDPSVADRLRFSSTTVVGVGVSGETPEHLKTKCWIYFPESNSPYYRVTVFSNYSPNNVSQPGHQWSLMAEVARPRGQAVDTAQIERETLRALREDGLLDDLSAVASVVSRHVPQGYPTPFKGRDSVVDPALLAFERAGVFSRGRLGAWKYEVSNQDHSFAQGYECVERCLGNGGPECEPTLFTPHAVNSRRNP